MLERVLVGLAALVLIPAIYELIKAVNADKRSQDIHHLKKCLDLTNRRN